MINDFLNGLQNTWTLSQSDAGNITETDATVIGQFHVSPEETINPRYSRIANLGKDGNHIVYTGNDNETFSIEATFFDKGFEGINKNFLINAGINALKKGITNPKKAVEKIKSWTKPRGSERRPPTLVLSVYNDKVISENVVITGLSVRYENPTTLRAHRMMVLNIEFERYKEFNINKEVQVNTRYVSAKKYDYYELMARKEYNLPQVGVFLRNRDKKESLQPGEEVALPAIEGARQSDSGIASNILKGIDAKNENSNKKEFRNLLGRLNG